jgi:hypothetical protein
VLWDCFEKSTMADDVTLESFAGVPACHQGNKYPGYIKEILISIMFDHYDLNLR